MCAVRAPLEDRRQRVMTCGGQVMFRGSLFLRHDFTGALSLVMPNSLDRCAILREARKFLSVEPVFPSIFAVAAHQM
jgi:hypothetical protein